MTKPPMALPDHALRTPMGWCVRPAIADDADILLRYMQALAEYEHYAAAFAVTRETLTIQGFSKQPADFQALVVEHDVHGIGGMLVYYFIPFTFRGSPTFYIKELFVHEGWRRSGLGELLMRAAREIAVSCGCASMRWQVARWNEEAARFYRRLGAQADDEWIDYQLVLPATQR